MCRLGARRVGVGHLDTTSIESYLVNLEEKGPTPQDRRFLYVDHIKRTTAALGVGVETIEPDHHLLNHLVTSLVAQVERAASVGSRARLETRMSCGCRPVAGVRAKDRSEVTSVSRKRGQGRMPRRGAGD